MLYMKLTNDFKTNLRLLKQAVEVVYPESTIMQNLCLAQAILESRLLGVPSGLAKDNNNLFGIKGKGTDGSVYLMTWEHIKGKDIQVKALFAKNKTLEDSIRQHRKVLSLSRYKKVWEARTFEEAANAVRECGYATDKNYSIKLIDIYNKYLK